MNNGRNLDTKAEQESCATCEDKNAKENDVSICLMYKEVDDEELAKIIEDLLILMDTELRTIPARALLNIAFTTFPP